MKSATYSTGTKNGLLLLALGGVFYSIVASHSQGPLTPPPGAPAPTMKTLDQVEPRTPISSVPFTISNSGSYYLAANLAVTNGNAITISTNDVTLDLNGFTISSTASPASGSAVGMSGARSNVTVKNGHIRGTTTFAAGTFTLGGFQNGVFLQSALTNVRVADISVLGVSQSGINVPGVHTCVVDRCLVDVSGTIGIVASHVRDSSAETCGTGGISAKVVRDSYGEAVGTAVTNDGIEADSVINSTGVAVGGSGILASLATNCEGTSTGSGAAGINIIGAGTASFCRGKQDVGIAINAGIAIGCTVNGTGTVAGAKFLGTP